MWEIKELGFNKENIIHFGNKFLLGHLKLGVRGTLDEYTKEELVALNLPLVYDQVGSLWRESVNAFNPLYSIIKIDGRIISLLTEIPIYHKQSLNMKDASLMRLTKWRIGDLEITLESKRFVSLLYSRMIFGYYKITLNKNAEMEIQSGIDLDIWDINGPHLEDISLQEINGNLYAFSKTQEQKQEVIVAKQIVKRFKANKETVFQEEDKFLKKYTVKAEKDIPISFEFSAYIGVDEDLNAINTYLVEAKVEGFDLHLKRHQKLWEQKWKDADVIIEGDEQAQISLRYSIYHLLLLSPTISPGASIPARGVSGQTYKGAIFWDTEVFMLPFYLNTDLASAKSIIDYRIQSLGGALKKAQEYGFRGAFYAWESQENGYDACTDYNVTDVLTKRKIRTYFRDKQIHISGAIVYAINSYLNHTQDRNILKEGALEVIIEVARFYLDYGSYKVLSDRFEIWDVMGPDEYHERVHNNAYTNQMVKMVFDVLLMCEKYFEEKDDGYFKVLVEKLNFEEELQKIKNLNSKVFIQKPNKDGIIEQFDNYFKLKDIDLNELLKMRLHPHEYLGQLASDTQIIKQADIITMLYLFRDKYDTSIMKKNWDYYEKRTEHGSSLSASMYALTACITDNPEYAYPLFIQSAEIDLQGNSKQYAGGIYIGGTHPAASGGAYLVAIYGFAGLIDQGEEFKLEPHLPNAITSISFKVKRKTKTYQVFVSKSKTEVTEIEND